MFYMRSEIQRLNSGAVRQGGSVASLHYAAAVPNYLTRSNPIKYDRDMFNY